MKTKIALFFLLAAIVLPAVTSLFNLEARRTTTPIVILTDYNDDGQTTISPN